MGNRIFLKGLDKDIVAHSHESILEALIHAGINVNYGCANGNCGLCIAHLVSGEIDQLSHSDYVMSAKNKRKHAFLACVNAPRSDCVIDVLPAQAQDLIAVQSFRVRIRSLKKIDDQVCILSLQPPRTHRLRFLAGQYAQIATSEEVTTACSGDFSIASCPCDARLIEFHVVRNDRPINQYIFEQCRVGTNLYLQAPYGEFSFNEEFDRPVILIAVGVGFASIKSLVEHISAQESEVPIHLYWLAQPQQHYFRNLCRAWEDALDQVQMHLLELSPQEGPTQGKKQEQDEAIVQNIEQIILAETTLGTRANVYCCAPRSIEQPVREVFAQQAPADWNLLYESIH